ncbi:MAG: amidohydrolase family protein [Alphaproteobacteria bacterium]|nr:amidohydrolase family protein [Alphaproteobacteria bacterium]
MQVVDAHHHFWDLAAGRHPWLVGDPEPGFFLGDYSAIRRTYLPDDYRRDADGFDVVATVHVEAEWDRSSQVAETEWLTGLNREFGLPSVIVGHVWLAEPACESILRGHMAHPLFRGVRSKPVTSPDGDPASLPVAGTMRDPAWRAGLAVLERLGLTYDLRVPYWHLGEAADAIGPHGDLPVVLNHTGFPWDRSEDGLAAWRTAMKTLAALPNVHVKLSELGLKDAPWTVDGNRRVVCEAVEIFGIDRCMWASNFPVAGLRIGYRAQLEGMLEILGDLSADDRDRVFRGNAAAFYRIGGIAP